jgi:hypothetical protein
MPAPVSDSPVFRIFGLDLLFENIDSCYIYLFCALRYLIVSTVYSVQSVRRLFTRDESSGCSDGER